MNTKNTPSASDDNYDSLRELVNRHKFLKEFLVHLSLRKNNEIFTRTTTLCNFREKKGYDAKRLPLTPVWKDLAKLEIGIFDQRWGGESRFIWSVDTAEFFMNNDIV